MYRIENADDLFQAVKHLMKASSHLESSKISLSNAVLESANNILKDIEDSKIDCNEEEIEDLKNQILKKSRPAIGVFEKDYNEVLRNAGTPRSYTLEFTTTRNCNWNCEYCFEHGSDRTSTLDRTKTKILIEKTKEFLDSPWFKKNLDLLKLDFWGGEPFLNPEPIRKFIDAFIDDERVSFHAYNNGSRIDPLLDIFEIASKKAEDKILIQFSYDGHPINDKRRKDKKGNPTGEFILKQARKTADRGIPVSFKATIMIKDFDHFSEAWDDYEKNVYYPFKTDGNISFSPTIDYTQDYNNIDLRSDVLKDQLMDIASKEIDFFKKENRFLLSWFSEKSSLCTAARNMTCVDSDGGLYFCHGCMYEDDSRDLTFGSIYETGFVNKLIANYHRFFECNTSTPDECAECVATSCYRCNVQKHQNSEKEEFMEKWMDFTCMREMCNYFKLVGKIKYALLRSLGG